MSIYTDSTAVTKLRRALKQQHPLRLAFLDIDGTWAGPPAEQQAVQALLEAQGYVITAVTNRASELCRDFDVDILAASLGTELLVRQTSGKSEIDPSYQDRLPPDVKQWQASVVAFLQLSQSASQPPLIRHLSSPNFRLEVVLANATVAEKFQQHLRSNSTALPFHITRDRAVVVITPVHTSKEDAVNHIVSSLLSETGVQLSDLNLLIAGDSSADLPMGLHAGTGTQATFLIPGGASLTQEINMTKIENYGRLRTVVIGDEIFPGTLGPQTLLAWLRQAHA